METFLFPFMVQKDHSVMKSHKRQGTGFSLSYSQAENQRSAKRNLATGKEGEPCRVFSCCPVLSDTELAK